jgi:hypothetical protein
VTRRITIIERIGLGDGKDEGRLSFNKSITTGCFLLGSFTVVYYLTRLHLIAPWYVWTFLTVVIGAGFGLKGYIAGVNRTTATLTQTDSSATKTELQATVDLNKLARDEAGD